MVTTHATCFNNKKTCILCTECTDVFHGILRLGSDCSRKQRQSTGVHTAFSEVGCDFIHIYIKLPKQLKQRRNTEAALAEWNYGI